MLHTSQPLIKPENTFVLDRKLISIHSVDRDHQKWPNSNQFGIDLGVAFSNVQSMRLVNFAVPTNNYTFSTAYQNTKMSFTYTVYYPLKFLGMSGSDAWLRMRDTLSALFGSSYAAPSDVTFEFFSDGSAGGSDEWTEMPWTGTNSVATLVITPNFFIGYSRLKWTPSEFSITIPEGSYSPTNLTQTIQTLMNKAVYNASAQPGYYFLPGPASGSFNDPSNVILDPTSLNGSNSEWYSSLDTGIKPFVVEYNSVRNRILFGTKRGSFSLLFGKQEIYDPTCDVNKAIFHQYTKWGLPSYLGFDKKTYTGDIVDINSDPYQESVGGLYLPQDATTWLTGDNRILDLSANGGGVFPDTGGSWTNVTGANIIIGDMSNNTNIGNLVSWLSSEFNLDINGEDAIYMEIDRYNSIDEIYPYSERTGHLYNNDLGHRVNGSFAKIPLTHLPFGQEMGSRNNFVLNVFHSDPPIQRIDRLKFTFRFHDGRLVDFKNLPFSFTLEFNMLKDEQTRGKHVRVPPLYNL